MKRREKSLKHCALCIKLNKTREKERKREREKFFINNPDSIFCKAVFMSSNVG